MSNSTEYVAMRRRMSRLRVQGCGKGSQEAEDVNAAGFRDLVKYWKKHGIPIPEQLLSDMADENVKMSKAKGKGRRRSRELEDLHLSASTGKFNLERLHEDEEETESSSSTTGDKKPVTKRQTEPQLNSKRVGSLKKVTGRASSPKTSKAPVARTLSNNK
ncbi:uncharacterized protein LOC127850099 isoform X3 [Dreissena polymorpha]|uniref:Uncharacterized protein n=1 Tax=Dreissena polymorpha TaxID=45954 RepID=A0A9D4HZW2_DREPO|nr:uncharacterized protein LOC127850099 isoform X3 [Dreissena polymorpha]KAH3738757.1 hypothetical protein DPMN_045400 [Dreissena polymorpha]